MKPTPLAVLVLLSLAASDASALKPNTQPFPTDPWDTVYDPIGNPIPDPWTPDIFDWPPQTPDWAPPPSAPALLGGVRGGDSLTLHLADVAGDETYNVIERIDGNSWTTVAGFGALSGLVPVVDAGLAADTRYCYRAVAGNNFGESYSPIYCAWTRDGTERSVVRLQLRVVTGDVGDADTDSGVWVGLNSSLMSEAPSGNGTWMNYGIDDFDRGDEFFYDLQLSSVSEIGDITRLDLYKSGSDWWCVAELGLLANGTELVTVDFSGEPDGCLWLDQDSAHGSMFSLDHDTLRAQPSWNASPAPLPLVGNAELRSRIEGTVGNLIHGTALYWDLGLTNATGRYVQTFFVDPATLHVDLDLSADIDDWFDPLVDIDFDLVVAGGCNGKGTLTLELTPTNVVIDSETSLDSFMTEDDVEAAILEAWRVDPIAVEVDDVDLCNDTFEYFFTPEGDLLLN